MRLEELINQHYNELNENDLMIWQYIQSNKQVCTDISIEALSNACAISRATISRFTQKIGFEGFREFKLHLKMELTAELVQSDVLIENVCQSYHKSIDMMKQANLNHICEHIYSAHQLFVFGTGEVQNAASKMIKRMFMNTKRFFVTLYGKSEVRMAIENICEDDLMIIISLSGENALALEAAKKLKAKGAYVISITDLSNNTLARLANENLYITSNQLMDVGGTSFESCASYFHVVELLCIRYLMYLREHTH